MLRVHLTPSDHAAVQTLRRDPRLSPHERDWVEMVLLSAAGWSPPRIATHLRCHPETVRRLLKRVQQAGLAALRRRRSGPLPDIARRQQVTTALDGLLAQERTWTARQLAAALTAQGITLSARQTRRYLSGMRARWRRTARTLKHKQNPVRVAQAAHTLAVFKKSPGRDPAPRLPGRVWLRPQPAGELHLGAGGGAETHPLREPAGATAERAGGAGARRSVCGPVVGAVPRRRPRRPHRAVV
jgi:transposase